MVGIAIILTSAAPNITEDLMPYYASKTILGTICFVNILCIRVDLRVSNQTIDTIYRQSKISI